MKKFKRNMKRLGIFLLILIAFMYVNNSSVLTNDREDDAPELLAHRGLAQTFPMEGITGDTCTAERIYEPEHEYLENTIPSIEAAFKAGADIVELDVQLTKDGKFAVFHDWTLECRTDGKGVTRDHTMDELKQLDLGYGYTADDGKTYPFRGKGVGLMPSLAEVLTYFPDKQFLIHVKSNDSKEGLELAKLLNTLPKNLSSQLAVYGGDEPIAALQNEAPGLRVMSKANMKSCLIPYLAAGWTGYIPEACHNTQLLIPEKIAPFLWGFPEKFVNRMEASDTRVVLVAGDGGWSEGFDKEQDVERLPENYHGAIWTNRIDVLAPMINP